MKLKRILAIHLASWPVKTGCGIHPVDAVIQGTSGDLYATALDAKGCQRGIPTRLNKCVPQASDASSSIIKHAQYELECKRVAAEQWNGYKDSIPPAHAFCKIVHGGAAWDDSNRGCIGMTVEVIGVCANTVGTPLVVCEFSDNSAIVLRRECLERVETEEDKKARAHRNEVDRIAQEFLFAAIRDVSTLVELEDQPEPLREKFRAMAEQAIADRVERFGK